MRRVPTSLVRIRSILVAAATVGAFIVTSPAAHAATVTVTTVAQLRTAVTNANGNATADEIDLVSGTTYLITGTECSPGDEDANATGDLDVDDTSPLTIKTPSGAPAVIQMGCIRQRIIEVLSPSGGDLILENVTLKFGHATEPVFAGGSGESGGAVLTTSADVTATNVTFDTNTAGGGTFPGSTPAGSAGGIGGNGGAISTLFGDVNVTGSTFVSNSAGNGGDGTAGGCAVASGGTTGDPGQPGGAGGQGGVGGAISSYLGAITVHTSTFRTNDAGNGGDGAEGGCGGASTDDGGTGGNGGNGGEGGHGGAIFTFGDVDIDHSTLNGNTAGAAGSGGAGGTGGDGTGSGTGGAGGIGGSGGNGGAGGGVSSSGGGAFTLLDSTLDQNGAGDAGDGGKGGTGGDPGGTGGTGGDGGLGGGGGQLIASGASTLSYSTITRGTVGGGGTGGDPGPGGPGGGTAGSGGATLGAGYGSVRPGSWTSEAVVIDENASPACNAGPTSSSDSADTDGSCGFTDPSDIGTVTTAQLNLGPRTNNGGPTDTRLPGTGSVLINAVPTVDCGTPDDQRGISRPVGPGCDTGSVEVVPGPPPCVNGTPGNDVMVGTNGDDHLCGLGGNDTLIGLGGKDILEGGADNDTIRPGTGNDTVLGGGGVNRVDYSDAPAGVTVNLATGTATGGSGNDSITAVYNATGSPYADTITGNSQLNRLDGGAGVDHLIGGTNGDYLNGGPGADTIDGGAGIDATVHTDAPNSVTSNLGSGSTSNDGYSPASVDTLISIESAYGSNAAGDTITGTNGSNWFYGQGGADTLNGGAANDTLVGGPGTDHLNGGTGTDTCQEAADIKTGCEA